MGQHLLSTILFGAVMLAGGVSMAGTELLKKPLFAREVLTWPAEVQEEVDSICFTFGGKAPQEGSLAHDLKEMVEEIEQSSVGAYLVTQLKQLDPVLCQYAGFGQRGFFDNLVNMIGIDPSLTRGQKLVILAHEMRHLDQYLRDYERSLKHSLGEYIRFTLVIEADAQAFSSLVMWELKELGFTDGWLGYRELPRYWHIGLAFEETYEKMKNQVSEGEALQLAVARALGAWFESDWLVDGYTLQAKMMFYDELATSKILQSYEHQSISYYEKLCSAGEFYYSCTEVIPAI